MFFFICTHAVFLVASSSRNWISSGTEWRCRWQFHWRGVQ